MPFSDKHRAYKTPLLGAILLLFFLTACQFATNLLLPATATPLPIQTSSPTLSPATAVPLPALTFTPSPAALPATGTPAAAPTAAATASAPASAADAATTTATANAAGSAVDSAGVRQCAYVPGFSIPAQMPPDVVQAVAVTPTPFPTPTLPASSPVDAATKEQQLKVFQKIWDTVNTDYVYRDFNGLDWKATGAKYENLINKGLKQDDFYTAMSDMINELGDGHSFFLSPKGVQDFKNEMQGKLDFVGIGGFTLTNIPGRLVMTAVLPGSPAEEAGLKPHDIILAVDGGPVLDDTGQPRTLGVEGSPVTITVQTPGQTPRDIKLVRRRITSQPKVDYCMVPGTHIGYIRWLTYGDTTIVGQTYEAMKKMTTNQPLDGLILDNRYNNGGLINVLSSILGIFTSGKQGDFISSGNSPEPFNITPFKISNSQTVPLVVLTGPNTQSAAEYAAGILHNTRKARLVGAHTGGHVEELLTYNLDDGSNLVLAVKTFQPVGLKNNVWEKHGVIPDVLVPERWDLFTEANDPAFGKAIDLLEGK